MSNALISIHTAAEGFVSVDPYQAIEILKPFEGNGLIAAMLEDRLNGKQSTVRLGMITRSLKTIGRAINLQPGEILEVLLDAKCIRLVKETIELDRTESGGSATIQTIALC
jgi:hypothetical protein